MMNYLKRPTYTFPVVIVAVLIFYTGCNPAQQSEVKTTLLPHTVPSNPYFTELWATGSFIHCADCLIAENGQVYLVGSLSQGRTPHLIRLNLLTADMEWQIRLDQNVSGPMRLTTDFIYMGVGGTQKIGSETQTFGSAQVMALDRNNGNEIWRKRIPGANAIALWATEQKLFALGNIYYTVAVLNAEDGQMLESASDEMVLFDSGEVQYVYELGGTLIARDNQQSNTLWQEDGPLTDFYFDSEHGIALVKTGDNVSGKVMALDGRTGQVLWEKNRVLSNVVTDGSIVYLLTLLESPLGWGGDNIIDAQLVALDISSGTPLGQLKFEPTGVQSGYGSYGYYLAADQGVVLVYLGDRRKLFALQFAAPQVNN